MKQGIDVVADFRKKNPNLNFEDTLSKGNSLADFARKNHKSWIHKMNSKRYNPAGLPNSESKLKKVLKAKKGIDNYAKKKLNTEDLITLGFEV